MGQKRLSAREQAAWAGLMMLLNEDRMPAITLAEVCVKAYRFADAVGKADAVPVGIEPEAAHGAADAGATEMSTMSFTGDCQPCPPDEFDQRNDQYDFSQQ